MDQNLENEIIFDLEKNIEKIGNYSIKKAAQNVFYDTITLSEQKKIAKIVAKNNHYLTEIKNGEVIVNKNLKYTGSIVDTKKEYEFFKIIMYLIVTIAGYLIFNIFLPSLKK